MGDQVRLLSTVFTSQGWRGEPFFADKILCRVRRAWRGRAAEGGRVALGRAGLKRGHTETGISVNIQNETTATTFAHFI